MQRLDLQCADINREVSVTMLLQGLGRPPYCTKPDKNLTKFLNVSLVNIHVDDDSARFILM